MHMSTYDINKAIYNNDTMFEVKYFIIIYEVANWNFLLSINFYNYYKEQALKLDFTEIKSKCINF